MAPPGVAQAEPAELLKTPAPNLPLLVDRLIIQRFSPAAVLTNDKGDILYISGRTGKYLEPAAGKANLNVFAMDLDYPDLAEDAREVLRTLVFKEKQVASRDGRWFSVRILPYRTLENVIDAVVITFTEATTGACDYLSQQWRRLLGGSGHAVREQAERGHARAACAVVPCGPARRAPGTMVQRARLSPCRRRVGLLPARRTRPGCAAG
jgi:hypothetical protein